MRAGTLRYKLTLLRPDAEADRFGAEVKRFTEVRTVNAERVRTSGSRSEEVGEHFADYRAEFNIRDAHPVSENWQVRQLGGHLYTVVAIVPNIDRGYKTLICERLNE